MSITRKNVTPETYSAPRCETTESVLLNSILAESSEGNLDDFDYVDLF